MDYKKSALVDEYITEAPEEEHGIMQTIRNLIFKEAPDAAELFEDGNPSYEVDGVELARFTKAEGRIDFFIESKEKPHIEIKSGEDVPTDLLTELLATRFVSIVTK